jgi:Zn-dependent protease with chaperone function
LGTVLGAGGAAVLTSAGAEVVAGDSAVRVRTSGFVPPKSWPARRAAARGCNRPGVNAYAAGRRSIAVTRQVLYRHRDGELGDDVLAGLLSHEVGHLITQSVRWSLIIAWFAMPWRLAYRAGARIAAPLAARQPRALLAVVVLTAFVIAISQAVRHGEWASATVLCALTFCPVISPIADAAISRVSEHEADRYVAQIGYNEALILALRTTQVAEVSQLRHPLLRDHPATERRLQRLEAAALHRPADQVRNVCAV